MGAKGILFDVKRFAVHDGPGIRTTVFLKGCPLKCVWCHNPEGISRDPQIAFYLEKCTLCGMCAGACPRGAHRVQEGSHVFDRALCALCGACAEQCLSGALYLCGKETTAEELLPSLLEDRDFYETSGGGVTLSGGECLCQAEFCAELLRELKRSGVSTAVDTCGAVPRSAFDRVLPYTDLFLYDVKAADDDVHRRYTGHSNRQILENLRYLDACGAAVEVRVPYVPGCNDGQMEKIADFLRPLRQVRSVKVLAYHNYAGSKYAALDMADTLPPRLPDPSEIRAAQALFRRGGD